jgi:hypothetical protein
MGYERHHAIIVTTWDKDLAEQARAEAERIFSRDGHPGLRLAPVSPILETIVNSVYTFMVAPDGSKDGWDHSDAGDVARAELIAYLNAQRYRDNSSPFDWVEVQYGDDWNETIVVSHSDEAEILVDA